MMAVGVAILLLGMLTPTASLTLAVVSKIIVDTIAGQQRPGGGGVQAACGATLGLATTEGSVSVGLHAPVGTDFDRSLLAPLSEYGIDTSTVQSLETVSTTPGEIISYDASETMSFTPVGWDGWETLCAWDVPTLAGSTAEAIEAIHVIVEGAGAGEVRSTLGAYKQARRAGELVPTIGVEPVMHEVSEASLDGLSDVTRVATACSPDLATAACMREIAESTDTDAVRRPSDASPAALEALRSDNAQLLELCAATFDALCMQPGSVLAIRDGSHGSYIYTRPAPGAPMYQWLTLERDFEWLAKAPAVQLESVADPTGAGNAYAGALSAQLAAGAEVVDAVAAATAVGAAFCRAAEAVPARPEEVRTWVKEASEQVRAGMRAVVLPGPGEEYE